MHFVDTNVLLYAISTDPLERDKMTKARELLRSSDFVLSAQVLQEFFVQATRKSRAAPLPVSEAAGLLRTWSRMPVQELTAAIVMKSIATCSRWRISYWDAAIIEAARAAGCGTVLSEDMQHGQSFDGVRVIDPFRSA